MDRRESLKLLLLAAATPTRLRADTRINAQFASRWRMWPDMQWVGPEYWGNRLQDWSLQHGRAVCGVRAPNRTLHCLTHRATSASFSSAVLVDAASLAAAGPDALAGLRLGANGRFPDYRSAAVHGTGLDIGIDGAGRLRIGEAIHDTLFPIDRPVLLEVIATPIAGGTNASITLTARRGEGEFIRFTTLVHTVPAHQLIGNIALVSHAPRGEGTGAAFADWQIDGTGISAAPDAIYGPIMFAQYTTDRYILKLTAQLAPIEGIGDLRVTLDLKEPDGTWRTADWASIDPLSRTARFRVDGYLASWPQPYRVRVTIPLADGPRTYTYLGTIAAEPRSRPLKVAVFNCNADHGFPDDEVARHAAGHRADAALFLGDQFYEGSGGFGIEHDTIEGSALDMLHKWYMFGWSYRELYRHIPMICMPDDHDVYHGNVWGEGGKAAPTDQGWGAVAQDQGGYKMWPEWVNAMQMAQTSHLPDPHDPTPAQQGIGVYYTAWTYAGVSFAILEDRKFKSAPANVLPAEAQVYNGWIQNPAFDITQHRDVDASLLGDRQMRFLEEWAADWTGGAYLKVVLTQTNFAAVHTIPESASSGEVLPGLPMPEPGQYVTGDKLSVDMDTNGWPQARRDEVLHLLRRCSAFHIAGDQHLATVVRHGIEGFGDAGYSFTGPALNNIWPRRWWPPLDRKVADLVGGGPAYTGDFLDGFGNKVTVHAAANPRRTGLTPTILRDRVTGYGMVTFDTRSGSIRIECWPRQVPPSVGDSGQYEGWPVEVDGRAGDGRTPLGYLPEIRVTGLVYLTSVIDPVVLVRDAHGELLHARRVVGGVVTLPVHTHGSHTVRVGDPERSMWQDRVVPETDWGRGTLEFDFGE